MPHYMLSLRPHGNEKVQSLDLAKHVHCLQGLAFETCALKEIPETCPSGPAVTIQGVQQVNIESDEDDASHGVPEDRHLKHGISHIFQPPVPDFFKALHVVQACFGKFEKPKFAESAKCRRRY